MVSRYFVGRKVRASFLDDDPPMIPNLTVTDHEAVDTGLITEQGDPIMRAPNPLGFGRHSEW